MNLRLTTSFLFAALLPAFAGEGGITAGSPPLQVSELTMFAFDDHSYRSPDFVHWSATKALSNVRPIQFPQTTEPLESEQNDPAENTNVVAAPASEATVAEMATLLQAC